MTLFEVGPDFSAVGGNTLASVVGALLTIVLIASVAAIITSATCWAIGEGTGSYHVALKAKIGVLVSLGASVLSGAGVAWMNFLIRMGTEF